MLRDAANAAHQHERLEREKKMKKLVLIFLCSISTIFTEPCQPSDDVPYFRADTQWAVVGAGPAGIIAIGLLIDLGIPSEDITWIDPEFKVGRIGKYYQHVPANIRTRLFFECLNACRAFRECAAQEIDELLNLDLDTQHPLGTVVKPLQVITDSLCTKIHKKVAQLTSLNFAHDVWHVGISSNEQFTAAHVILATGAKPKTLDYECKQIIPLDFALDKPTLETLVAPEDTIAVIGSAHSAILILKYLSELPVGRIFNFYIHEPEFHHPELGLGGATADWAKNVLLPNPPANLIRVFNRPAARKAWISICNKVIYAIGFERDNLPPINSETAITYDEHSGIIAPRLFGIGIAFPEKYVDEQGTVVSKIDLPSFMEYAQRLVPEWMSTKEAYSRFASLEELFDIRAL
jgi:hypothetical protein